MRRIVITAAILCMAFGVGGCAHSLEWRNRHEYNVTGSSDYTKTGLKIRIVNNSAMREADVFAESLATAVSRRGGYVIANDGGVTPDVIVEMNLKAGYHGKVSNFFVSWPGFLIFMPAWRGYQYVIDYNFDLQIKAVSGAAIGTLHEPCRLEVRHADFGRTWAAGCGWFFLATLPAAVNGFYVITYDKDVTPLLCDSVCPAVANFLAAKVVQCINTSVNGNCEKFPTGEL